MEILITQVVIVGAGPSGLSMAAQLFRHGIDFILLEKKEATTALSKAIVVQARTLEIFQELGIAEEAVQRGRKTTELKLFRKGKQQLSIQVAELGQGLSEFPFALSLEQSKTETLLAEYVLGKGKQIHWESELTHFEQGEQGVTVSYRNAQGKEQKIQAAYLVGCDGASSTVRHQLGLSFEGSTEPKLFYVADVVIKSPVINSDALHMYMIEKGFVLFFPMEGEGHYRIVGILPKGMSTEQEYAFSDVAPFIQQQIISPLHFEKVGWFSTYEVHSRKADVFQKGRCFVVGDAAHIHTPAGGQGMNTGIQDAYNLAWKIAYTLRGELNRKVLETYHEERSSNAKHLLQTTDRLFDIMSGANPFWNFLRLHLFPLFFAWVARSRAIQRNIFPLLSQIGIAYPNSPLTVPSKIGKVRAGMRMPYFVFSDGKSIFHYLSEPVFKLLYFGAQKPTHPWENDPPFSMVFLSFQEIPTALFAHSTEFYLLLRPDNHISFIGPHLSDCQLLVQKLKN